MEGQLRVLADILAAIGTAALFLLPGLALVLWLRDGAHDSADAAHDWRVILLLAPGVTIALFPLVMLAARLAGITLGAWAAWGLIAAGALGTVAALARGRGGLVRPRLEAADLALLLVAVPAVLVRMLVVSEMTVPAWGDSVQHTVIAQLMQDHGGLFSSWAPYTPFDSFTVQYGFHAGTAFFQWLVNLPTPRAVVLSGQVMNALAVLGLYPLAVRVSRSRWGGVAAVLAAGLLSPTPMVYVNWGRYPQLAGQAVLPAFAWLVLELIMPRSRARGAIVLAGVTAAGGLLCSYRMLHFYGMLGLVLFLACAPWREGRRAVAPAAGRLALAALLGALLILPWQLGVPAGVLDETFLGTLTGTPVLQRVLDNYRLWELAPIHNPPWLLAAAAIGFGWALVRRRREALAAGLWVLGLAPIVALRLVRFPTSAFFENFGLVIALYIPVALLAGWLAAEAVQLGLRRMPRLTTTVALIVAAALAARGAVDRAQVLDDRYVLVTPADQEALAWVRAHVPENAVFAVNGFTILQRTSIVGSDAGWWLPLLAGRANLMPPQYALTSEHEAVPGYRQMVTGLIVALAADPAPAPAGVAALCRAGATHVYVGQTQGTTGSPAAGEAVLRLDPQALAASQDFAELYHRERVWVFALAPGACAK